MSSTLVEAFFSAMENGDRDGVRAFFHPDIVSIDNATGKVSKGIEENMEDMELWMNAFSDIKVTCRNHHEVGSTVITEMTFSGINDGDMAAPDGSVIPATGKSVTMHGCQFCEFAGEQMVSTRQYYDMLAMMAQLGLMG